MPKELRGESANGIIIENSSNTAKSTSFSKKDYEWLVENSMELIRASRKNKWDKKTIADIHGFFYASMAGVIRSGALCSRETGNDGFPEIHTIIQDTDYHCRENVLYAILGKEAEDVIHPYEDSFSSYALNPNMQNVGRSAILFENEEKETSDGKKKRYSKDEMEEAKKEIESLKNQMILNEAKSQKDLVAVKTELKAVRESKEFLENQFKNNNSEDRFSDLQNKLIQATNEVADAKIAIEKVKQEKAEKEQGIMELEKRLQEEKEKKKEEPAEYEYYYREILPKLATSLGTHGTGLLAKFILSLVSLCGIAAAMWVVLVA